MLKSRKGWKSCLVKFNHSKKRKNNRKPNVERNLNIKVSLKSSIFLLLSLLLSIMNLKDFRRPSPDLTNTNVWNSETLLLQKNNSHNLSKLTNPKFPSHQPKSLLHQAKSLFSLVYQELAVQPFKSNRQDLLFLAIQFLLHLSKSRKSQS